MAGATVVAREAFNPPSKSLIIGSNSLRCPLFCQLLHQLCPAGQAGYVAFNRLDIFEVEVDIAPFTGLKAFTYFSGATTLQLQGTSLSPCFGVDKP